MHANMHEKISKYAVKCQKYAIEYTKLKRIFIHKKNQKRKRVNNLLIYFFSLSFVNTSIRGGEHSNKYSRLLL